MPPQFLFFGRWWWPPGAEEWGRRGDKGRRLKGGGYGGDCDGHEKDLRCRNKLNVDTFSNTATLWDGAAWKRGSIGILWKEEKEERKEKEERAIAFPSQVLVWSLRWRWITKSFCTLQRRDRRDLLSSVENHRMVLGIWAAGSGVGQDHVWSVTSGQLRSICQRRTGGISTTDATGGLNHTQDAHCTHVWEMKHSVPGYRAP